MSDESAGTTDDFLLPDLRLRGQRAIIVVTLFDTIAFGTALGSVVSLFVLNNGGTSRHIGMLATAGQIAPIAQIIGLHLLPRFGKARLVMHGHALAAIPITVLAVLTIAGLSGAAAVWAAIAAVASFGIIFHSGQTAWWPLIQDNTAGGPVESFFARMRTRYLLMNVLVAVGVAIFMGKNPPQWRFIITFLCGVGAMIFGGVRMRHISERPFNPPEMGLTGRLARAWHIPSIRRYVRFAAARVFVIVLCTPFWVVILKNRGLSEGFIVWLSAVVALGNVSGVRMWGRFVNRHNFRPAITIALLGEAALGFAWLALPAGGNAVKLWAIAFHAIWGFLEGGYLMGWTRAMLSSVPSTIQADGFTLSTLCGSSIGAATGLLAGVAFKAVADADVFGIDCWAVYLCCAQLLLAGVWVIGFRLKGYERQVPFSRVLTISVLLMLRQAKRMAG